MSFRKKPRSPVLVYKDNELIGRYESISHTAVAMKVSRNTIKKSVLAKKPVTRGPLAGYLFRLENKKHHAALLLRRRRKLNNKIKADELIREVLDAQCTSDTTTSDHLSDQTSDHLSDHLSDQTSDHIRKNTQEDTRITQENIKIPDSNNSNGQMVRRDVLYAIMRRKPTSYSAQVIDSDLSQYDPELVAKARKMLLV